MKEYECDDNMTKRYLHCLPRGTLATVLLGRGRTLRATLPTGSFVVRMSEADRQQVGTVLNTWRIPAVAYLG